MNAVSSNEVSTRTLKGTAMNRKKTTTIALSRETLHSLEAPLAQVAGGTKNPCSVRFCPQTPIPSEVPCTANCSLSCG
jgi:hypothetical protein